MLLTVIQKIHKLRLTFTRIAWWVPEITKTTIFALSALLQFKNKYNNNTTLHTVLQYISAVHEIQSINCSHNVAMKINISFFLFWQHCLQCVCYTCRKYYSFYTFFFNWAKETLLIVKLRLQHYLKTTGFVDTWLIV